MHLEVVSIQAAGFQVVGDLLDRFTQVVGRRRRSRRTGIAAQPHADQAGLVPEQFIRTAAGADSPIPTCAWLLTDFVRQRPIYAR